MLLTKPHLDVMMREWFGDVSFKGSLIMGVAMDTFVVGHGEQAIFNSKVWWEKRNGKSVMMYMQVSVFKSRYDGVLVMTCLNFGERKNFNIPAGHKAGTMVHRGALEIDHNADGSVIVRVPRNLPKSFREPKRYQMF